MSLDRGMILLMRVIKCALQSFLTFGYEYRHFPQRAVLLPSENETRTSASLFKGYEMLILLRRSPVLSYKTILFILLSSLVLHESRILAVLQKCQATNELCVQLSLLISSQSSYNRSQI